MLVLLIDGDIGKVDEEEPTKHSRENGQDAEEDEDPTPALKATQTMHLLQAISEDAGAARRDETEGVEGGVALLHVVAAVPGRNQVYHAREVARLENTEDEAQRNQDVPILYETEADLGKWVTCGMSG